jgi:hypothetical protein
MRWRIQTGMDDEPENTNPKVPNPETAIPLGQNPPTPIPERWTELCRQASVERDPKKLLQLVTEINRLLAERQARLARGRKPEDTKY